MAVKTVINMYHNSARSAFLKVEPQKLFSLNLRNMKMLCSVMFIGCVNRNCAEAANKNSTLNSVASVLDIMKFI
jgi:hypothetical protein